MDQSLLAATLLLHLPLQSTAQVVSTASDLGILQLVTPTTHASLVPEIAVQAPLIPTCSCLTPQLTASEAPHPLRRRRQFLLQLQGHRLLQPRHRHRHRRRLRRHNPEPGPQPRRAGKRPIHRVRACHDLLPQQPDRVPHAPARGRRALALLRGADVAGERHPRGVRVARQPGRAESDGDGRQRHAWYERQCRGGHDGERRRGDGGNGHDAVDGEFEGGRGAGRDGGCATGVECCGCGGGRGRDDLALKAIDFVGWSGERWLWKPRERGSREYGEVNWRSSSTRPSNCLKSISRKKP
jgi:hypothetical protein